MKSKFALALAVAAGISLPAVAQAQSYPNRSVRMIIAFSAGGSIDTLGRILAQKLGELWGHSVVVENRTGGGGNIGTIAASQAAPDGYTLHFAASSIAVNVTLAPVAGFDPMKDFEPVMLVASAQDILIVPPTSPFKTVKDLIAEARANPKKLTYASLGNSSAGHLGMSVFSNLAGIQMQQVTYTQTAQITTDVMSGRIDTFLPTTGGHIGNVTTGRVRALAVSGKTRAPTLPDVPTFDEQGVKMEEDTSWYAMFAPKGTPKEIVDKVNADLARVLQLTEVKERETALGFRMIGGPPDRLRAYLKSEIEKWAAVAKTPAFTGQ
jgi:tripartite-type tricarboxylate transporter receptor subunit TctC